jgi:uncharacterized protein (DUF4415 family)
MTGQQRRPTSAKDQAEALFKAATTTPEEVIEKPMIPIGKETISISIDRDVLAHFQDDGPGWRDRLNVALRRAANLG